ncbi:MAG TPA: flagellar export chaperone FliS [Candidatus Paceibacterota bacterium]|nr:flagellar export chaperone FliS [Candidatus Paceibacterota bacterium]
MHAVNPWKSYRQIATQTAPPGQLVLMLYDGAIRFLERSLAGFQCDDPAESNMTVHNNLQRAVDILRELNLSLNMEQGGEFAATLRKLYNYFDRRIWESNMQKNPEGIREVIRHITVLRDAWASMLTGQSDDAIASNSISEMAAATA